MDPVSIDWLFLDNDGTLVDTEAVTIPLLLAKIKDVAGVNISLDEFYANYHGLTVPQITAQVVPNLNHRLNHPSFDAAYLEDCITLFKTQEVPLAPGLPYAIRMFHEVGYRTHLAIVSNEPAKRGMAALESTRFGRDILHRYTHGYTEAHTGKRKPQPDVYLRAMARHGTTPEKCRTVEDSVTGVKAAVAAGIPCYGFVGLAYRPRRAHIAMELLDAGAMTVFEDWERFPEIFRLTNAQ